MNILAARSKEHGAMVYMYNSSKRAFEDPPSQGLGLTMEQARRSMLVREEKLEEAKPQFRSVLESAKVCLAKLHQNIRSAMEGTDNPPSRGDDPIVVFQEVHDVLREFEDAVDTYYGSTMDSEATKIFTGKQKEFEGNIEWSNLRLKKVQKAMESHN